MSQQFHQHAMLPNTDEFICNCCNYKFESGSQHIFCPKCNVHLCQSCYTKASTFQSNDTHMALHNAYNNPLEKKKMDEIYNVIEKLGSSFSSKFSEQVIDRAHSRLYLFEEQKNRTEMELKPTRIFDDENGNTYAFFGSHQAKEMLKKCKDSVDSFITNHWIVCGSSRFAPELQMELNQKGFSGSIKSSYYARNAGSGVGFVISFGLGAVAERKLYRPIFEKAMSSARFQNAIQRASLCSFLGCVVELDKDYHIRPSHLAVRSYNVPDHNLKFDWSDPGEIPKILSILTEIKKLFPNLQMNKDENAINLLLSALDYIDQGTFNMSINPLFTDDFTTKMIAFTRYSILDTQIFLRLKPKSLEIFKTTSVYVYQTDKLGDRMNHSFLTQTQFANINKTLLPDIREELSRKTADYSTVVIDPLNIAPSMQIIDSLITSAEIKLAQLIGDISKNIMSTIKTSVSFWSTLQSEYQYISSFFGLASPKKETENSNTQTNSGVKPQCVQKIQNVDEIPNSNITCEQKETDDKNEQQIQDESTENTLTTKDDQKNDSKEMAQKQVTSFVEKYWSSIEDFVEDAIKQSVIPQLYSENLAPFKLEIAQLKHLKELIFLCAEIERRKNDNIPLFNIDLGIENCETCLHKYHINMIV